MQISQRHFQSLAQPVIFSFFCLYYFSDALSYFFQDRCAVFIFYIYSMLIYKLFRFFTPQTSPTLIYIVSNILYLLIINPRLVDSIPMRSPHTSSIFSLIFPWYSWISFLVASTSCCSSSSLETVIINNP